MFNFLEQALKSLTKKCIAGINTGIFGGGEQGCVQFVYAMMSLHMIYWEKSVVYTKKNRRLSFDFECQSHNFTIKLYKSLLIEPNFRGGDPSAAPPPRINSCIG